MVERPSGSPRAKVTSSPSEDDEEPEVLQLEEEAPGREKGPSSGHAGQEATASSKGSAKRDKLELGVGPAGAVPPMTPTSPAEALAEGILTQVRRQAALYNDPACCAPHKHLVHPSTITNQLTKDSTKKSPNDVMRSIIGHNLPKKQTIKIM